MDIIITLIIFSPAILIFGYMIFSLFRITGDATDSTLFNKTVNNAIVDLYETGYIKAAGEKGDRKVEKGAANERTHPLHESILAYGFSGDTIITAKEFHTNIYHARKELRKMITPDANYDSTTKPSNRVYSNSADENSMVLLPLLFLGTPEGSHFAGNPSYSNDGSYAGSSDFGGDSSGGDSGGDGGGGGGD